LVARAGVIMDNKWLSEAPGGQHLVQHGLAFLLSGCLAFTIDASITKALIALAGMHPIPARLIAISIAMVAGWLAHRRFTFRLTTPPSFAEFLRYAALQWTVAAINYGIFVVIVIARPTIEPLVGVFVSSLIAMVFSYLGMRFAAFRQAGPPR
jgi:putative flippase GtrA